MEHGGFHIYTAKIGLPKNRSEDKSKIESVINLPGIKIEFHDSDALTHEVIGPDANSATSIALTVERLLEPFPDSN